jgi:acyl carrier protein
METPEFIENFAEQFDETDTSGFTLETNFKDLDEWSSMTALSIIAMADDAYNVKLTGDEIRSSQTIQDIYNIIKSKL